jgi:hypothetical protein
MFVQITPAVGRQAAPKSRGRRRWAGRGSGVGRRRRSREDAVNGRTTAGQLSPVEGFQTCKN